MISVVVFFVPVGFVFSIIITSKLCNGVWNPFIPYRVSNMLKRLVEARLSDDWVLTKVSGFTAKKVFRDWWEIYVEIRKKNYLDKWTNCLFDFNERTLELRGEFNSNEKNILKKVKK